MSYTKEELSKFSGEEYYMRNKRLNYFDISLDGNEGNFVKSLKVKDEWIKEDIGQTLEVILLRVRRRLQIWDDRTQMMYSTNEYNSANEVISLYHGKNKIETGIASA